MPRERVDAALHRVGKIVVRGVLVREQRVAAARGHLDRIQRRRARRNVEIRIVGVKVRAGIGEPERLPVLDAVGQDQDVRVGRMMELVDDVRLGRPEAARERQELRRRQRLRAEDEHLRAEERALDVGECRVGQRIREVDAEGLGAEARRQRMQVEHDDTTSATPTSGTPVKSAAAARAGSPARRSTPREPAASVPA